MVAQNGGRRHWADLAFEAGLHRLRLAGIRNNGENFAAFEDLPHRHRKRLFRDLRGVCEPCLAHLLLAASLIEIHDDVWLFGLEICWRIIECDMTVFTNAE